MVSPSCIFGNGAGRRKRTCLHDEAPRLAIKWILIAAAVIGIFVIAAKLAEAGNTLAVVLAGMVGLGILAVYATRRGVPLKYLVPGVLLMILFQLWPVVYTANLSFTNYGDGHLYSKEESVTDIIAQSVREVPGRPALQDERGGRGGREPRDGRPRAAAHRPRRSDLRRRPERPHAASRPRA